MVGALVGTPVPLRPHPLAAGSDDDFGSIWYFKPSSRREQSGVPEETKKTHHETRSPLSQNRVRAGAARTQLRTSKSISISPRADERGP